MYCFYFLNLRLNGHKKKINPKNLIVIFIKNGRNLNYFYKK